MFASFLVFLTGDSNTVLLYQLASGLIIICLLALHSTLTHRQQRTARATGLLVELSLSRTRHTHSLPDCGTNDKCLSSNGQITMRLVRFCSRPRSPLGENDKK